MTVLGLILVASMVLAACAPQTLVETKVVEVEKKVEVEKTVVVEKEVEVQREPFTTPHPILGDIRVRQAIAYCTNKLDLIKAVYPLISEEEQKNLVMNTFIPTVQWAYAGDENITIYPFDPEKGKALLEEAGWTGEGIRVNAAGDELALKFTTTNATFRQTWAAVFEKQMANCGIRILRFHVPASWWFGDTTGLSRRDFELGAFAWVGQADPGGQTMWACDQIPLPSNGWEGQNYMGWCNEAASTNIKLANNSLFQDERKAAYTIVQQEYTKDVPAIPLFNRTDTFAYNPKLVNFAPKPGYSYYMYNSHLWEKPGDDTIVLGFTQEPASLYTLVENAFVAVAANYFVADSFATSNDYTWEAKLQDGLSTLESGLALNNDVEVKAGDKVVDAEGNIVELSNGVKVKDATGAEVEFTGAPVKMKQMVVTYKFIPGITWSDGKPLVKADFELGYKIACDRENGATSFITCDRTQSVTFDSDTAYTVTWLPGVQDGATYFLAPYGPSPSHQVIESEGPYKGKTLAEVPAKDWPTLPEIAEKPLGFGPYVIKEWVKGEKIVYEANPYYVLGVPKTKNIVILFITPENAEAQLLAGGVDVLDSTTLVGVTETLNKAEAEGKIVLLVNPSATWEHIDFNLFVK
jgi:ABC-type transport system substrate-binding protein